MSRTGSPCPLGLHPAQTARASEDAEPSIWASGSLVGTEDRLRPKIQELLSLYTEYPSHMSPLLCCPPPLAYCQVPTLDRVGPRQLFQITFPELVIPNKSPGSEEPRTCQEHPQCVQLEGLQCQTQEPKQLGWEVEGGGACWSRAWNLLRREWRDRKMDLSMEVT